MVYYPVIIPTLNRYEHLKDCVESLAKNTYANETELVIGLDYPPSEKYMEGWQQIKEYIPTISGFKKLTVIEHKENLGPIGNTYFLQNYVLEHYDAYIYTEDDNVFSPCFLDFMNKGLEKYRMDENVIAVCAYLENERWQIHTGTNTVIKLVGDYPAWGIGCWKDKGNEARENLKSGCRRFFCDNRKRLLKMFGFWGQLNHIIFWLDNPLLDYPCDFTISAYTIVYKKMVVCSAIPLVKNMGYDGSGENCGTLDDNYLAERQITDDKIFNLVDHLTDKDIKYTKLKYAKELQKKDLSAREKSFTIFLFFCYLILGYDITEKIRKLPSIKRIAKSILKKLGLFDIAKHACIKN